MSIPPNRLYTTHPSPMAGRAERRTFHLEPFTLHFALLALLLAVLALAPPAAAQPEERAPERLGFATAELDSVLARAEALDPLNSLLIARGDSLVAARYFRGLEPGEAVNLKSASKSLLSPLVGIAIEEGHLRGVDQQIGPFFPEILDGAPRKQAITLRDLLTMRAGLESTSFGNYGAWVNSASWVRDALRRPLIREPGTGAMIYSTGTTHILSVLLTKATGTSTRRYAQAKLFDPLGIEIRGWQQDPQGYYFGGNNLATTPRALLRIGQLYLRGGRTPGGEVVVPPDWLIDSWQVRVTRSYRGFNYGYLWWIEDFGDHRTYFAWGYGGQFLFVVPSLDLVAVATSSLTNRPDDLRDHSGRVMRFFEQHIVPAAETGDADRRF
jgi:CubicO group peptidase (beta-lactamase class C family)